MSLNAAEIDRILAELDLVGGHIQAIAQLEVKTLLMHVWSGSEAIPLRIVVEHPFVRLHRDGARAPKKRSHQRFEEFLTSRIRGGRIVGIEHVGGDRIVRIDVVRASEATRIWIRLWGPQANVIVTDETNTILDVLLRKPAQRLVTGAHWVPPPPAPDPAAPRRPRDPRERAATDPDYNAFIRRIYADAERKRALEREMGAARRVLERRLANLERRHAELSRGVDDGPDADARARALGELVMANVWRIAPGATEVEVEDWNSGGDRITIALDPALSPAANAERWFDRARRSAEQRESLAEARAVIASQIAALTADLESLPERSIAELREVSERYAPRGGSGASARDEVGLRFRSHGFDLFVGRNARENDALLRRAVRGNDWWFHTRDYPGGYVFVKAIRGKSLPLEVMLDAGQLALLFSRGRRAGAADLYYTQVKHLRRAKGAALGTVLPTQEKNLRVEADPERLRRLGIGDASLLKP